MAKKKQIEQPPVETKSAPMPKNNKKEVQKWLSAITYAEKYRENQASKYRWRDFIEEFKGHFRIAQGQSDIDIQAINFVFAYVKTEIPALYLKNPYLKVNAKKASAIQAAKILEEAINYDWRHKKLKRENKKNIWDGKLIGHSWFKSGYTGNFGTVEDGNGETIETIESEDFFGYRVPWDCITFDPDSIDPPHDCKWIAHDVWVDLADAKSNPRYKNTDKLTPESRKRPGTIGNSDRPESEGQKVRLREVWDIKNQVVFTVSNGVDDYIEDPKPWPYEMRGYPFSFLNFNPVNDEPYGMSDVYMFESQVFEITKVRAMMLDHIKRFNRQLVYNGQLTQEQKDSIALGITANVTENVDGTKLLPIPYPQLQTDIYGVEKLIKEDMINISGQSPQERGATQQTTTRTFRELAQIARGAENRRSEQIDVVEEFIADIAQKRIALMQQFADVPYYVRITGKNPEEIVKAIADRPSASLAGSVTDTNGFTFTREDIQGEFDVEVVPGSTAPLNKDTMLSMLLDILQLLPSLGIVPGGPVVGAIGRLLADMFQVPELKLAMEQEAELQAQLKSEQQAQAEQAMQLRVAETTANTQIEAEKIANKQNETLLKAIMAFKPEPLSEVK